MTTPTESLRSRSTAAAMDIASATSNLCLSCKGKITVDDLHTLRAIRIPRGVIHTNCPLRDVQIEEVNDEPK